MLDLHPALAVAPETHFIRRFWLQRDRYGDLREDAAFARLIADVTAMPEFPEMAFDAVEFRERAFQAPRSVPAVFWLVLEQFATARGARLVGEKTPNHLLYMPTLQRFFPAARFVHIVRDPRSVVNSWRNVPWSTGTIAGDSEVWRRYLATARRRAPAAGTMTTVHYEDLVVAPEATLRALCGFLRLDFEPAMLLREAAAPATINVAREPWKLDATQQLSHSRLDRWRKDLRPDQVREIEGVVWAEMRRMGYLAETSSKRVAARAARHALGRTHQRFRRRLATWLH